MGASDGMRSFIARFLSAIFVEILSLKKTNYYATTDHVNMLYSIRDMRITVLKEEMKNEENEKMEALFPGIGHVDLGSALQGSLCIGFGW